MRTAIVPISGQLIGSGFDVECVVDDVIRELVPEIDDEEVIFIF